VTSPSDDGHVHLHHHPRGSLRRAALRFAALLVLLGASFAAVRFTPLGDYLTAEHLQEVLGRLRGAWWSPIVHVSLCLVFGSVGVPATPLLLAGAAIFGVAWGILWNWVGILAASAAGFLLARLLGREFVERIGGEKLRRAEKLFHRRGFLPLIAVRFVPIPFSLVNAAAAVVGVKLPRFLLATAVGLLPPIAILTYFANALLGAATGDRAGIARQLLAVSLGAAFVVFLPIHIRRRQRQRRLRELRARRARRPRP
jgi:uncharacterized membrane protein YdjX (TVP38/TMEM64 family)